MKFGLIIFYISQKIFRFFLSPLLKVIFKTSTNQIPPLTNHLLRLPAVDLAAKIKRQEVSSLEVIQAYIERIRQVNPLINSVTDQCFKEALAEAKEADRIAATKTEDDLKDFPFFGVPLSVKECNGIKGLQQCVGIMCREQEKAEQDGECVRLMRAAGAIPICVTNVSEWAFTIESYNHVNGRTRNPHDLSRTSGGSSGGEAALIGAGASLIGVGSDIGGSIRGPALFCGIFGHKPTPKIVSMDGHFPCSDDDYFVTNGTIGPMVRYAKDLKPMFEILSGQTPRLRLDVPVALKDIKVYYKYDFNDVKIISQGVDKCIKSSMTKALDYFRGLGNRVVESRLDLSNVYYIQAAVVAAIKEPPEVLDYRCNKRKWAALEFVKSFFGFSEHCFGILMLHGMNQSGKYIAKETLEKYTTECQSLKQELTDILGDNGVFFFPTFPTPAFKHCESWALFAGIVYCQLFNFLGFPSTQVPMGYNRQGLPVGFQVVAAPFQDRLCFAVAEELEKAFGGWAAPNRIF